LSAAPVKGGAQVSTAQAVLQRMKLYPQPLRSASDAVLTALHHGSARMPLAWIVPDGRYPDMWRILWPDGRLSDLSEHARRRNHESVP